MILEDPQGVRVSFADIPPDACSTGTDPSVLRVDASVFLPAGARKVAIRPGSSEYTATMRCYEIVLTPSMQADLQNGHVVNVDVSTRCGKRHRLVFPRDLPTTWAQGDTRVVLDLSDPFLPTPLSAQEMLFPDSSKDRPVPPMMYEQCCDFDVRVAIGAHCGNCAGLRAPSTVLAGRAFEGVIDLDQHDLCVPLRAKSGHDILGRDWPSCVWRMILLQMAIHVSYQPSDAEQTTSSRLFAEAVYEFTVRACSNGWWTCGDVVRAFIPALRKSVTDRPEITVMRGSDSDSLYSYTPLDDSCYLLGWYLISARIATLVGGVAFVWGSALRRAVGPWIQSHQGAAAVVANTETLLLKAGRSYAAARLKGVVSHLEDVYRTSGYRAMSILTEGAARCSTRVQRVLFLQDAIAALRAALGDKIVLTGVKIEHVYSPVYGHSSMARLLEHVGCLFEKCTAEHNPRSANCYLRVQSTPEDPVVRATVYLLTWSTKHVRKTIARITLFTDDTHKISWY